MDDPNLTPTKPRLKKSVTPLKHTFEVARKLAGFIFWSSEHSMYAHSLGKFEGAQLTKIKLLVPLIGRNDELDLQPLLLQLLPA